MLDNCFIDEESLSNITVAKFDILTWQSVPIDSVTILQIFDIRLSCCVSLLSVQSINPSLMAWSFVTCSDPTIVILRCIQSLKRGFDTDVLDREENRSTGNDIPLAATSYPQPSGPPRGSIIKPSAFLKLKTHEDRCTPVVVAWYMYSCLIFEILV